MRFKNKTVLQLVDSYKPIWALNYTGNLVGWDSLTYMPKGSADIRGVADSQLELLSQKLYHDPKFIELLRKSADIKDLNDYEKGVVRVINHRMKIANLPSDLIAEDAMLQAKANVAWNSAKKKSDFSIFAPYLTKIVDLQKRKAEKLGYKDEPYDALLNLYEEGAKTSDTDKAFAGLMPGLKNMLETLENSDSEFTKVSSLETAKYDTEAMKNVNSEILKILGMDFNKFRVDLSSHPFTMPLSSFEARVGTRYIGANFKDAMFALIHETGHALHFLQLDPALDTTPLSQGFTLGIAESQSKFFDAMIARSREFTHLITPILRKNLSIVKGFSEEEIYNYFNTIIKGPIRVAADEFTYHFHIALRYKLERMMLDGEIKVKDLPEMWNSMMVEYLGIKPKNDAEGVLQDSHWARGFGYFPTYTLGVIASGVVRANARKAIRDFDDNISNGNFAPIKEYLRKNIHQYGTAYTGVDLLKKSFNDGYNPKHFLDYLKEKHLQ